MYTGIGLNLGREPRHTYRKRKGKETRRSPTFVQFYTDRSIDRVDNQRGDLRRQDENEEGENERNLFDWVLPVRPGREKPFGFEFQKENAGEKSKGSTAAKREGKIFYFFFNKSIKNLPEDQKKRVRLKDE